jgi:transcriptional regulator with XRE-family HTH domain
VKIGRRVKEERVKRFWTQERLAEEAGISERQVVRIERNQVEPHFSTILKLAEALEVEPSESVEREK